MDFLLRSLLILHTDYTSFVSPCSIDLGFIHIIPDQELAYYFDMRFVKSRIHMAGRIPVVTSSLTVSSDIQLIQAPVIRKQEHRATHRQIQVRRITMLYIHIKGKQLIV